MAIATRFDLKIKQFDIVNAFINIKKDARSALITYKLPDGFKKQGICVEIDRALYRLRDSLAL
jgi:hypothetical protein